MTTSLNLEICPDCKLALPPGALGVTHAYLGASASCWEMYGALLMREIFRSLSAWRCSPLRRWTPTPQQASGQGNPKLAAPSSRSGHVHLVGLYLTLERELHPDFVRRAIGRLAERNGDLRWLDPPESLGAITVADVMKASTPEEHREMVLAWARAVWDAWAPHRTEIVRWADEVVRELCKQFLIPLPLLHGERLGEAVPRHRTHSGRDPPHPHAPSLLQHPALQPSPPLKGGEGKSRATHHSKHCHPRRAWCALRAHARSRGPSWRTLRAVVFECEFASQASLAPSRPAPATGSP